MAATALRPDIGTACTHCGTVVPAALVTAGAPVQFCCTACHTAYDILQASGLGAFYEFPEKRGAQVSPTRRSFDEFDHPAFAELYVKEAPGGLRTTELYLEGVHCASCVWLVERVPLLVSGVARAELDVRRSVARVSWDAAQVPLSAVARALDTLGYAPHPYRGGARAELRKLEDRAALLRIGVAGAIAINVMLAALALYSGEFARMELPYERLFRWASLILTVPALAWPGRVFFTGALSSLRTRTLHMDVPIAIALAAGAVRGAVNTATDSGPVYFDGVCILVFLLLTGRFLQVRGQRAATDAAELLYSLAPSTARVREADGSERELPAMALLPGMDVVVRAGESFPADGELLDGPTSVNAALLTGESRPATVRAGEPVFAGTLNLSAPVVVRVRESGEESRLARLLRDVEASAARRAPVIQFANRIAGIFVAVALGLAALTFVLWAGRDGSAAWDNAIALLVVTCPCALALATPLAVTVAIGRAARAGIYIKGGDALELLATPGIVVLDKTGTITEGRTAVVAWEGAPAWRGAVLALEAGSSHPIADGFRRAWPDLAVPATTDVEHVTGGGITGQVEGATIVLGSPAFVRARATGVDALLARLADPTLTPVVVARDGVAVAVAGLGDKVRDDAAAAIADLQSRGWEVRMLSGDDPRVAQAVARQVGIAAAHVTGGATPETKLAAIEALKAATRDAAGRAARPVVMVGDGVNDAAAIATADVGIGVHGGAEACLATADAYLTMPGLGALVAMADGATRTMRVIRRNMAWALAYNLVGVTLAMTGTISPLIAALMMPASSLTVVLGSWLGRTFTPAAPAAARQAGAPTPAREVAA
jgi:Cu2+-exporting ATPase